MDDARVTPDFSNCVNLLKFFRENTYTTGTHAELHDDVEEFVLNMWSLDYACMVLDNTNGVLCEAYPRSMIVPDMVMKTSTRRKEEVPVYGPEDRKYNHNKVVPVPSKEFRKKNEKHKKNADKLGMSLERYVLTTNHGNSEYKSAVHLDGMKSAPLDGPAQHTKIYKYLKKKGDKLHAVMESAKFGRSRQRMAYPTILYQDRYIARSSTVPLAYEVLGRMGLEALAKKHEDMSNYLMSYYDPPSVEDLHKEVQTEKQKADINEGKSYLEAAKIADVKLLKTLRIKSIFDLMVEKGKVKYYMLCSSSEKSDGEVLYKDFQIEQIPYPGCEFFTEFKRFSRHAERLHFDFDDKAVDTELSLTEEFSDVQPDLTLYKTWSLSHLTKVYLLAQLKHLSLHEDGQGFLVHCISGWDRTPLFISLLRISLWADGQIHQSLSPMQMLYFTIAFDWMLCGHNLKDRTKKGEEIMFFCFYFLKYIKGEEFNILSRKFGVVDAYKKPSEEAQPAEDSKKVKNGSESGKSDDMDTSAEMVEAPCKEEMKKSHMSAISAGGVQDPDSEILDRTGGSSTDTSLIKEDPTSPDGKCRTEELRYKRLTELRTLWFDVYKKACEDHDILDFEDIQEMVEDEEEGGRAKTWTTAFWNIFGV